MIPRWLFPLVLLVATPAQAGPHDFPKASECDALDSIPITPNVDYAARVRPLFGAYGCIGCHNTASAGGGLDLSGGNAHELCFLVGVGASAEGSLSRVDPGNARDSFLYQKIGCESVPGALGRMPPGSTRLTLADQAAIYDWITQGARGDPGFDCEPSPYLFVDGLESTRN